MMENKMVTVDEESSEVDCEDQKQRNETKKLLKPVMGEKCWLKNAGRYWMWNLSEHHQVIAVYGSFTS